MARVKKQRGIYEMRLVRNKESDGLRFFFCFNISSSGMVLDEVDFDYFRHLILSYPFSSQRRRIDRINFSSNAHQNIIWLAKREKS